MSTDNPQTDLNGSDLNETDLNQTDPTETEVATGDRRDEVHFEPDPNQLVVARHLVKPDRPLPPDLQTTVEDAGASAADMPPIEDVLVAPDAPSVWDARPAPDDAGESGNPTEG